MQPIRLIPAVALFTLVFSGISRADTPSADAVADSTVTPADPATAAPEAAPPADPQQAVTVQPPAPEPPKKELPLSVGYAVKPPWKYSGTRPSFKYKPKTDWTYKAKKNWTYTPKKNWKYTPKKNWKYTPKHQRFQSRRYIPRPR